MAFDLGSVIAHVKADTVEFKKGLSDAKSSTTDLKSQVSSLGDGIKQMAAIAGISLGAAGVVGFIKSSVEAAAEWQRVQAQTNAVITSTGNIAGVSSEQVDKLARSIQESTPISHVAAQEAENMLLTFTSIGSKVFPEATQATIDMTTAMGGGLIPTGEQLKDTAIQIGRALNDPINGLTSLHRMGVAFNQNQKDQIKSFIDQNNQMAAQKIILDELGREFGGSAAAQLNTFDGQMAHLTNSMTDAKEMAGGALIPALEYLTSSLGDTSNATNALVFVFKGIGAVIISLSLMFKYLGQVVDTTINVVYAALSGRSNMIGSIWKTMGDNMVLDTMKASTAIDSMNKQVSTKAIGYANDTAGAQIQAAEKASAKIKEELANENADYAQSQIDRKEAFDQSLADLVKAHQDKVSSLNEQMSTENTNFTQNMQDQKDNFAQTMQDMKDAHDEKVQSIEQQIQDEVSLGNLANMTKIQNLQASLAKENDAYNDSVKKADDREATTEKKMQEAHDKAVKATQDQLDKENAILNAHQAEVAATKNKAATDDITRLENSFKKEDEKASQEHEKKLRDIIQRGQQLGDSGGAAMDQGFQGQAGNISNTLDKIGKEAGSKMQDQIDQAATKAGEDMIGNFVNGLKNKVMSLISNSKGTGLMDNPFLNPIKGLQDIFKNLPSFDTGGIVGGGSLGDEVVAKVHVGEKILPNNNQGIQMPNVIVNMDGAIIADSMSATSMGEKIGDAIIHKLKKNIRI